MSQGASAAPLPDVPGFAVERRLGAGGSCEVWLAREREGLRRVVALKVYRTDPSGLEARERELEAVRRVEALRRAHPDAALLRSLAAGDAEGVCWLAFEAHEEGTLEDRVVRGGPLPFGEAVDCARQVAQALALLHADGLYHRDVKPSNLLVGRDGRVLVADFGLSRPLAGTLSSAGSPAFAAPEAIAGRPHDGRKLDVYSVGATLAWLLTGETMLPGRPDVFLLERHGVPRPLQRAIVRAMALDPRERTPTAEALLDDLAAACRPPEPEPEPLPPGELPSKAEDGGTPAGPPASTGDDRRRRAWTLVERTGYAAAAATTLPIPGSEWLAVLPLHVGLVIGVGEIFGCTLDERGAADLVKRVGAVVGLTYLGGRAITTVAKLVLPGAGGLAGAVLTFAATLGLGAVVIAFFEREGALDEDEIRELYGEALRGARQRFDPRRAVQAPAPDPALVDRLARLDRLLESGLISREEHEETTRRIHEG